ncbi:MAG: T9SS type A sorting domain-containing protein, partial [Chlorobi bacterium]|nr:T9SS type A sorting domain-containing protein [Chlorobiota bacterium]
TTFDGENWKVYEDITDVTDITIDGSGSKWIGTRNGGVYNFDGNKRAVYNSSNSGLPNNEVFCIAFDSDDTKWIATYGGLSSFSGDPVSVIQHEFELPLQMKISPNPMDQYTIISYNLDHSEQVVISITDMLGNYLASFDLQTQEKGSHSYRIDGSELSSGTYIVTVNCGAVPISRKIIVMH